MRWNHDNYRIHRKSLRTCLALVLSVAPAAAGSYTLTDLGALGSDVRTAFGLNAAGQVVGTSDNRAFVWTVSDGMIDLNSLLPAGSGWQLVRANGINDAGQIGGQDWSAGTCTPFC